MEITITIDTEDKNIDCPTFNNYAEAIGFLESLQRSEEKEKEKIIIEEDNF